MRQKIVHSSTILTLLGGGPKEVSCVKRVLKRFPVIVAADGGADFCVEFGLSPEAVIGDMDSISARAAAQLAPGIQHRIAEQDSTDFEKCLRNIDAPAIVAMGFSGGRLDHELSCCAALTRFPDQRCVLLGREDLCFLAPSSFTIDLPRGTRFSLFPMAPVTGQSRGLKYPIDGIEMEPTGRTGTSNEVKGRVDLTFSSRHMLVLLPSMHLDIVLDMLTVF